MGVGARKDPFVVGAIIILTSKMNKVRFNKFTQDTAAIKKKREIRTEANVISESKFWRPDSVGIENA